MAMEFETDGTAGTNQLGCVNMYAGANGADEPMYYFDNFGFYQLSTPLAPPTAEVELRISLWKSTMELL
jgi:hypothetical protein